MNLMDYLIDRYGYDEPIFSEELSQDLNKMNPSTMRQNLKRLVDSEKLYRYKDGIFFIPNPNSYLKKKTLSVTKIINKKYIYNNNETIGYVTGISFANSLQLTTQNPGMVEIVTNKETNRSRIVNFNKRKVGLRRPRVEVNESNYKLLQVLDLLNNYESLTFKPIEEVNEKITKYLKETDFKRELINECLSNYPTKAANRFWESGLYNELTLQ